MGSVGVCAAFCECLGTFNFILASGPVHALEAASQQVGLGSGSALTLLSIFYLSWGSH